MSFRLFILQAVCFVIAGIIGTVIASVIIFCLGMLLEGITYDKQEYERCLKHATNGYEIEKCR